MLVILTTVLTTTQVDQVSLEEFISFVCLVHHYHRDVRYFARFFGSSRQRSIISTGHRSLLIDNIEESQTMNIV
jgi:hypothetical protein